MKYKKPTALLSWSVLVTCPFCQNTVDMASDEDGWLSEPIFNNRWDDLKNANVFCYHCDQDFEIEKVEA